MKIRRINTWIVFIILILLPIALFPGISQPFTQGKELFLRSAILLNILITSICIFQRKKITINKIWDSKITRLIVLLAISVLVSTFINEAYIVSVFGTFGRGLGIITYGYIFVWLFLLTLLLDKKDINLLTKAVFISGVFIGLYGFFQRIGFDPLLFQYKPEVFEDRSFSFIGNPTLMGQYLSVCFIIGLNFLREKSIYRPVFIFMQLIILMGLFAAEARAAIIALVIGLALYFYKTMKVQIKKLAPILSVVVILAGLFVSTTESRFGINQLSSRSVQSRVEIWSSTIQLIAEKPLFGYGPETFYINFPSKLDSGFFEAEEDLNSYADRVHNETLAMFYSLGLFGGLIYLSLMLSVLFRLYKSKDYTESLLLIGVVVNAAQNQLGFADLNMLVMYAFLFGCLIVNEVSTKNIKTLSKNQFLNMGVVVLLLVNLAIIFRTTIGPNYIGHWYYGNSKQLRYESYELGVLTLQVSLNYIPHYAEPWYDLMMINSDSTETALENINRIEGRSPNWIAWTANSKRQNIDEAKPYYEELLALNPKNPHWVRAYGDAQYVNQNYNEALALYKEYLEIVPVYWKWKDTVHTMSEYDQKRYRIFFKNNPDFWSTINKIEEIEALNQ
jgi:O-antigen ligase